MRALLAVARVIVWMIDALCLIAMVALAFAFFLLMFGANPTAQFTQLVYSVAKPFMAPFATVFPGQFFALKTGGGTVVGYVNLGIVVAFFAYAIVSAVVSWIYSAISRSYYRRQAQSSLARDVSAISTASAAAAGSQAQAAQAAAQAAQAAQAAAQAQAAAPPAGMPPEPLPFSPAPAAASPVTPVPYPPSAQPPAPDGPA